MLFAYKPLQFSAVGVTSLNFQPGTFQIIKHYLKLASGILKLFCQMPFFEQNLIFQC